MDARKRHYLEAMDIPVYVPRSADPRPDDRSHSAEVSESTPSEVTEATITTQHVGGPLRGPTSGLGWDTLAAAVKDCRRCGLCETRTQTVFGVGDRSARWMVIGEAPGADEDQQGEPFVGRAGRLLNSMLEAAGAPRKTVFIANILKCRPPENRDPRPEEADQCRSYLERQIELVAPDLIIAVGRIAAQNLLRTETPIGKLRGQVHHYGDRGIPVVATYHPAYLLRSPGQKRRAWDDLKLALGVASPHGGQA